MWGRHVVLAGPERKPVPAGIVSCDPKMVGVNDDARAKHLARQVGGGNTYFEDGRGCLAADGGNGELSEFFVDGMVGLHVGCEDLGVVAQVD